MKKTHMSEIIKSIDFNKLMVKMTVLLANQFHSGNQYFNHCKCFLKIKLIEIRFLINVGR